MAHVGARQASCRGLSGGRDSVVSSDVSQGPCGLPRPSLSAHPTSTTISPMRAKMGRRSAVSLCANGTFPCERGAREGVLGWVGMDGVALRRYSAYRCRYVTLRLPRPDDQQKRFCCIVARRLDPRPLPALPAIRRRRARAKTIAPQSCALCSMPPQPAGGVRAKAGISNGGARSNRIPGRRNSCVPNCARLDEHLPGYPRNVARAAGTSPNPRAAHEDLARIDVASRSIEERVAERLRQFRTCRAEPAALVVADRGSRARARDLRSIGHCRKPGVMPALRGTAERAALRAIVIAWNLVEIAGHGLRPWPRTGRQRGTDPARRYRSVEREASRLEGHCQRHFDARAATVRGRSGGDDCRPATNRPRRHVQAPHAGDPFPQWERSRMPLLFVGRTARRVPARRRRRNFVLPRVNRRRPEWERADRIRIEEGVEHADNGRRK